MCNFTNNTIRVNELKKKILSFLILLIILIYPLINIAKDINQNGDCAEKVTPTDILKIISQGDVGKASVNIKKAKKELSEYKEADRINAILESIDKGELSYRNIYKNTFIAGDSLMNSLELYNILNSNNLCTQVSASLYHLSDNMPKIIAAQPEILILHYGLNLVDVSSHQPASFISFYTKLIAQLKKELPDTRIIVSSIFCVDNNKATAKRFLRIDEYNQALKEMCKKNGVEFLDNTVLFEKAKSYYAYDGIHLKKDFYEKVWLRYIVKEKGVF